MTTVPDARSWPEQRLQVLGPEPIETKNGSRYDYPFGGDEGYDWMADANPRLGFKEIAGWGADGWDLGNWPYVIISLHREGFTVLTYCEGDLTFEKFATPEDAIARIDGLFLWHAEDFIIDELVKELGKTPTTLDEVPGRFRGKFAWSRVDSTSKTEEKK